MPTWFAPRLRRWVVEHPFAADVLFSCFVGLLAVIGAFSATVEGSERAADIGVVAIIAGQTVAFSFRRRAPLRSLLAVTGFTIVFWLSDYATNFDAVSLLSVYAATAHGGPDRRRVWQVVGGVVATMTAIAIAGVLAPSEDLPAAAIFGIAALHITAAITGEVVHDRRQRLTELEQRALRAEAERELMTRQAVFDERARIARDLHDVVAHGMSVMVVQAGAAERMVATDPRAASTALGHIQHAGREALAQMRQMLDVLRDEHTPHGELLPQPTLDDVHQLVRHCDDSGIATTLSVDGEPPSGAIGQQMAAYRIVQEALTNVIKHAGPTAQAAVRIGYRDDEITIEVNDNGIGTTETALGESRGHGFVGMRERVDLYGGTLRFGPRPGGGFRVAATVPLERTTVEVDR